MSAASGYTEILEGDARARLADVASGSVQVCITSPPYWGLREYGIPPSVWGGSDQCDHTWQSGHLPGMSGGLSDKHTITRVKSRQIVLPSTYATCTTCGAFRGVLGGEPAVDQYVANLVAVFREVRRTLHDTGTLVLNLGDSYSGSGGSGGDYHVNGLREGQPRVGASPKTTALPAKNLCMVPFRVALALQADGWILQSVVPWIKRAVMPESVLDRPTTAAEYIFLFAKRARYFWDAEAIRMPHSRAWWTDGGNPRGTGTITGRNYRNSDAYFVSLDEAIAEQRAYLAHLEHLRATGGGLLLDEDGEPLALDVPPEPSDLPHFAMFPTRLVATWIQACTPPALPDAGVCATCGTPRERCIETVGVVYKPRTRTLSKHAQGLHSATGGTPVGPEAGENRNRLHRGRTAATGGTPVGPEAPTVTTIGWGPGCTCSLAGSRPALVLDPFSGSGTTLLVASRLGRDGLGIEISSAYVEVSRRRLVEDAPLFADLEDDSPSGAQLSMDLKETDA